MHPFSGKVQFPAFLLWLYNKLGLPPGQTHDDFRYVNESKTKLHQLYAVVADYIDAFVD